MKYVIIITIISLFFILYSFTLKSKSISQFPKKSFYSLKFTDIHGKERSMEEFKGKNILIVNVASECGFTYQYKDLQNLYTEYKNDLVVIGFPCNQFGDQEPGGENQIKSFCESKYDVTFLLSSKIDVKGYGQHPVYQWLTSKDLNGSFNSNVKWNFQKYFINRDGYLVNYFYSITSPKSKKITSLIK